MCSDTRAVFVGFSFILILREGFNDGFRVTLVVTPCFMEMPAPREPFSNGSGARSHIWKSPVM